MRKNIINFNNLLEMLTPINRLLKNFLKIVARHFPSRRRSWKDSAFDWYNAAGFRSYLQYPNTFSQRYKIYDKKPPTSSFNPNRLGGGGATTHHSLKISLFDTALVIEIT